MSTGGPIQPRPNRNERREAAREKARVLREEQKKREKRTRFLIIGGVVVTILAIGALIFTLVAQNIKPAAPGPLNMASDGILLIGGENGIEAVETPAIPAGGSPTPTVQDNSGTVANIVVYVDYLCPYCGQFERTNSDAMRTMVEEGAATLEIHPIAILTNKSQGTQYSLRAANAAACVAEESPEAFYDFNSLLFEEGNQPDELTEGLTNDQLKELAAEAGAGAGVDECVDEKRFHGWVQEATNRALTQSIPNSDLKSVTATPTVLVNGKQYVGSLEDEAEFQSFVLQAAGEAYSESNATPTPTPAAG